MDATVSPQQAKCGNVKYAESSPITVISEQWVVTSYHVEGPLWGALNETTYGSGSPRDRSYGSVIEAIARAFTHRGAFLLGRYRSRPARTSPIF